MSLHLLTLFRLPFFAAVLLALAALVAGVWVLFALALLLVGFVFLLGRDPQRIVPSRPLGVVSPVDAHVESVGDGRDPFLDRDAVILRLRQGIVAPAVLHSPVEGRVEHIWGHQSVPHRARGSRMAVHLRTDEGDDVVFAVRKARLPGPLRWTIQPGERVGQGQRRGLAGWGRRIVVYLPAGSTPAVQSRNRVHAGADVIGQLVHPD